MTVMDRVFNEIKFRLASARILKPTMALVHYRSSRQFALAPDREITLRHGGVHGTYFDL